MKNPPTPKPKQSQIKAKAKNTVREGCLGLPAVVRRRPPPPLHKIPAQRYGHRIRSFGDRGGEGHRGGRDMRGWGLGERGGEEPEGGEGGKEGQGEGRATRSSHHHHYHHYRHHHHPTGTGCMDMRRGVSNSLSRPAGALGLYDVLDNIHLLPVYVHDVPAGRRCRGRVVRVVRVVQRRWH